MFAAMDAGTLDMRDFKQKLAWEIVSIFHGDDAANQAAEDARRMHEGEVPSDAPVYQLAQATSLLDLMSDAGLTKSKGEARRLIQQGGVRLDGAPVEDLTAEVAPDGEHVVQVGKRKFLRVVPA
ncbi:MAG: hypothetical protein KDD83_19100 [Caldilineaceae bacterium]|nr:hypothetical protein [Caldilineaceae bacterium]